MLKPSQIYIHYYYEPKGHWWSRAAEVCEVIRIEGEKFDDIRHVRHFAHKADFIRLDILSRHGGIYLDLDVFCLRDFDDLRGHQAVLGVEPNTGLCNAVIAAAPAAAFIARWRAAYDEFTDRKWNAFSVRLPFRLARENPELIHVEDMYAFFFPAYADPASAYLWRDGPQWRERLKLLLGRLPRLRFYAYPDRPVRVFRQISHAFRSRAWCRRKLRRSYCIHLWESLWWEPHLAGLDPERLETAEGLFPELAREVLGGAPR